MYCNNCGKNNPEGSKFCQHCGIKFDKYTILRNSPIEDKLPNEYIAVNNPPYPYVISIWKLIIMCVITFGIYEIYWFYRQWKSFNAANNLKHGKFTLWIYSLFAPLSSYSLFKHISNDVKEVNNGKGLEAGGLAIVYFFLTRFWLGFLPLITVQNKINFYWEKKYQNKLIRSNFGVWNWIIVIIVALIVVYAIFSENTSTKTTPTTPADTSTTDNSTSLEATYEQNFMSTCNSDGKLYGTCACLLRYLRANYSFSERLKLDEEYNRTKQVPQAMYDAINSCASSNR